MNTENEEINQHKQKTVLTWKVKRNSPKSDHLKVSIFENGIFLNYISILKHDQNKDAKPNEIIQTATCEFNYMSPDGFTIRGEDFRTHKEADQYLEEWLKQFEIQGYYSSTDYGRIPLDQLKECCDLCRYIGD